MTFSGRLWLRERAAVAEAALLSASVLERSKPICAIQRIFRKIRSEDRVFDQLHNPHLPRLGRSRKIRSEDRVSDQPPGAWAPSDSRVSADGLKGSHECRKPAHRDSN
jgi:hypothetical protein